MFSDPSSDPHLPFPSTCPNCRIPPLEVVELFDDDLVVEEELVEVDFCSLFADIESPKPLAEASAANEFSVSTDVEEAISS